MVINTKLLRQKSVSVLVRLQYYCVLKAIVHFHYDYDKTGLPPIRSNLSIVILSTLESVDMKVLSVYIFMYLFTKVCAKPKCL